MGGLEGREELLVIDEAFCLTQDRKIAVAQGKVVLSKMRFQVAPIQRDAVASADDETQIGIQMTAYT